MAKSNYFRYSKKFKILDNPQPSILPVKINMRILLKDKGSETIIRTFFK